MAEAPSAGFNVSGFTILGPAGRGGMGTVFVAEQHTPRRTVALKVLSRAADPNTLAQFRQEAAVIAELEHPRIVPLYSYGEQAGQPYLVMRYLGAGSVADRLRDGPVQPSQAARWVEAIAEALDFAHGRGLVHRDVKPSNILVDELGNAYLSDFGIAGALADARAGLPTGSAAYMSPEQARGERVDRRADIYSLAVTLFESLTGKQPYSAETALGVIVRHIHDPIPSARNLNPSIPLAVDELILWAMAKDPAQRPQTAAEFARLLRHAIEFPEATLRPAAEAAGAAAPTVVGKGAPGASTVVARPARPRSRWVWGLGAIVLMGLLLVGGVRLAADLLPSSAEPRPTATLPAVPPGEPTSPPDPAVLLRDDFSDPTSGFAVLSDADGGVEYADGSLRFTVHTVGVRWYSFSGRAEAADVEIEANARIHAGPPLSEIALLCRWRGLEDFTALAIRADGSVGIWQLRGGETEWLLDWSGEPGAAIQPGQDFKLGAACEGTELRLSVNGTVLASATDPHPRPGDVALMAGLGADGQLVVTFDDLVVRP